MSGQTGRDEPQGDGRPVAISLKRRGLLASAWAAVAAVVAMRTTQPVAATAGGGADGNLVMGSNFGNANNTAIQQTNVLPSGSGPFQGVCVLDLDAFPSGGANDAINGVYGHGKGPGAGVVGVTGGTIFAGGATFPRAGVYGLSFQTSDGAIGVRGEIPAGNTTNAIAMYGLNSSSYAGPGPGAGGFGVYGLSARGHGLVGATASEGAAAVVGATNGVVGAYAATFYGPVVVSGDFLVVGSKSAAVPHPDGTHRLLYCVESPESWFEDFGKGQLDCGRADIVLDHEFATVADLSDYHVFLTELGGHHALSVTRRTPTGFSVEADAEIAALKGKKETDLVGEFSWRVVAKRKDIAGARLAPVTIPREPVLPDLSLNVQASERQTANPHAAFGRGRG